ncbi:hypothetical protein [Oryzobacter terrae]|uniref:hypothetical protein n=1 Tax=Oryzobacter terrae TaxID=1620385 RepID=UPI00366C840C
MRWDRLFADLEGQLAAGERRELDDEVAERTRRERALVPLADRLAQLPGSSVTIGLVGGRRLEGELADLGDGWMLLRTAGRDVLVPLSVLAAVTRHAVPGPEGPPSRGGDVAASARRFGLGSALRALSRDRATVAVHLVGVQAALVGTIDAVGADHLDLAEHPEGTVRRRENVSAVTTVATSALLLVESRR